MSGEKVDGYLATVARLEPDLHMVDTNAALASIAISMKRLADSVLHLQNLLTRLSDGITDGE